MSVDKALLLRIAHRLEVVAEDFKQYQLVDGARCETLAQTLEREASLIKTALGIEQDPIRTEV